MSDSGPPPEPSAKSPWSTGQRIAFRFGFSYLLLYILMNGNVTMFVAIPVAGTFIQGWLAAPGAALSVWVGKHFFHLTGIVARWHGGGSGDRALDYIRILCFLGVAVVATLLWSALDWRRPRYPLLQGWLRFLSRLTVGTGMLFYGFTKVFPLQMREPSFAILNNTYGNSSPFTLLWTMIGLHPGYEIVCGAAEVAGGLLILFRRTATLGTLLSAGVMANVVLYNLFFDVPVKIYSLHLLALCLYLLLPELGALWRCAFQYNGAKHQLTVNAPTIRAEYQWVLPDPDHLRLTWTVGKQPVLISLHRLPAPEHYALIERGFRWINEWGYER